MNANKAIASGVAGTLVSFLTGLQVAVGDDIVTQNEWVTIALATVIGAAAAFGITYSAPANTPKGE